MGRLYYWTGIIAGSAAVAAVHALLVRHYYFLCDDAFISFRYLYNWISGFGLVYNPGERVEGYTNLGWVLLLAPAVRAGIGPDAAAPALSIFFSYALLALVVLFPVITRARPEPGAPEQSGPGPWACGLLAALLLAGNRSYGVWATSGLETRMFSFLVFAGLVLATRGLVRNSGRALIAAGAVFGLAELARPEAPLFGAAALALAAVLARALGRPIPWKGVMAGALVLAGATAVHYLWRYSYYGDWLPNTYYVKASGPRPGTGARYLAAFGIEYFYWAWTGPMIYAVLSSWRRRDPVPAAVALLILPYITYVLALGGDHFEYRFFDPALPVLALLSARGAAGLVRLPARKTARAAIAAGLGVLILYHLYFPIFTETRPPAQYSAMSELHPLGDKRASSRTGLPFFPAMMKFYNSRYGPLVEGLVGVRWEDHRYLSRGLEGEARLLNRWIKEGKLLRSERFCIQTAGIIPYRTRVWTLDYFGLANAQVARLPAEGARLFHEKKAPGALMEELEVDYIYLEISEQGPGDDPIISRVAVPLNDDEVEMLSGPSGPFPLMMACDGTVCMLFSTPRPAAEIESRLHARGLSVMIYVPSGTGVYYPGK